MVCASLTLTIPERTWIGTVSRSHPTATFRVRSAQSADGVGVGFVELLAAEPAEVIESIRSFEPVYTVDVFHRETDRALVQIEADKPILLEVLDTTGVPVEMPFEIQNGQVEWEVTTTRNRLSTLGSALDDSEVGYVVGYITDDPEFDRILTDTQQRLIRAALNRGYYESPRQCTQEELASSLDMAKSTCSEILHRAEERIVKSFERDPEATRTAAHETA